MSSPAYEILAGGDFAITVDDGTRRALCQYRNVIVRIDYLDRDVLTVVSKGTDRVVAIHRGWVEVKRIAELPQQKPKRGPKRRKA